MNLSQISIQRPVLATMMSLSLVLFGAISLSRLPVRELPDIDPPIVSVRTTYFGANAAVVETEVTERLEEAVNNVPGIKTLSSRSREQSSRIDIEFDLSRDIDIAAQEVRDRVARVRGLLPDAVEEPVISKQDSDARPVLWIAMESEHYTPLEMNALAERQIKNRLQTVEGVSSIFLGGEQRYAIRLWLDSERMAACQVTMLDVRQALRLQNLELPSGRVESLEREMTIQTLGEMKTAEAFRRLVIRQDGDRLIRLSDVGEAVDGVENLRSRARSNGKPCIFLGVVKQSKANAVGVSRGIREQLKRVRPTLPPGIRLEINYDEAEYVEKAISEVWLTLGFAFLLVVVVIYAFLHSARATIIPAVVIPVSIVANFLFLHWFGYSVNVLTMLALILAIGIVVDDAIVVLENIHRHIESGQTPMEAARRGMKEISFAVVATTLALVAVFTPLAFQTTTTGRLFVEFAIAISGAVVVSTFVALSLTPTMCARLLRPVRGKQGFVVKAFERGLHRLGHLYEGFLRLTLERSLKVRISGLLILALGLGFLTFFLFRSLEGDFLPPEDKGRMFAFVVAPDGATSEYTDRMLLEMEGILAETEEVAEYGAIVAPGFSGPGLANNAIVFLRLEEERERSVQEIVNGPGGLAARFFGEIEGAIAIPNIPKTINRSFDAPFRLVLQAPDLKALDRYAQELSHRLRQEGFLASVRSTFEINKPELRLSIDRDRAAVLGVSVRDISETLQVLFGGLDLSKIKKDGREYDVIAQLRRQSRLTPRQLDQIYVRNDRGELVQLNNVIRREVGVSPNVIERYNRIRSTTISGSPINMPIGTAVAKVDAILAETLPPGFLYEWQGESKDFKDAGQEILWVLVLALVIVYMVLAAQFESLVHPLTVMLTVPLAAVGAVGLLWLLQILGQFQVIPAIPAMNINLFSQIGLILLVGLVTKNGILLVEFANQMRASGESTREAMIRSGLVRLRPILMTAVSTISGVLPIAVGFGAGAESRRPMGVVVVGGMLTSTFLTLFVIPTVYTVISDLVESFLARKRPLGHEVDRSTA